MSMEKHLNNFIEELIQEIEQELDEATATGNIAGYNVPGAFSNGGSKDKKRKKKISTQFGMKIVGKIDEDGINEAITKISSSNFKKLEAGIKKINQRIKISLNSSAPGGFEIQIPDDSKWELHTDKVQQLTTKITGDHRNGRIFYEGINESKLKPKKLTQLKKGEKFVFNNTPYEFLELYTGINNAAKVKTEDGKTSVVSFGGGIVNKNTKGGFGDYLKQGGRVWDNVNPSDSTSVNEAKVKRPVNRWLELKNDETMHAHKKMAMGLKELKYQLGETQKFFNWYNKIKTMNELDSSDYWKRTQSHIYKIKERLINIAKTLQEIEK